MIDGDSSERLDIQDARLTQIWQALLLLGPMVDALTKDLEVRRLIQTKCPHPEGVMIEDNVYCKTCATKVEADGE